MPPVFTDFSFSNIINDALARLKFTTPTPIQAGAIPEVLAGREIVATAQTGTGKTLAYMLPIMQRLLTDPKATALVLAPTRELAVQIADVVRAFSNTIPAVTPAVLIGGAPMFRQLKALQRKPRIIVATPGRMVDHLKRRSVSLDSLSIFVLDEADRMLDMGFETQINEVYRHVKGRTQTLMFSATMPGHLRKMIDRYMKDPKFFSVGEASRPAEKIKHEVIRVTPANKKDILLDQLNARQGSVLIFVNTKHNTNKLTRYLEDYGFAVTLIHGGRSQGQRTRALQGFRNGEFRILVATDVAARGLDVPHIAHVINFDIPKDIDDYVHRIGRTARAGAEGEAICLLTDQDHGQWNRIAKTFRLAGSTGPADFSENINGRTQRHHSNGGGRTNGGRSGRGRNEGNGNGGGNKRHGGGKKKIWRPFGKRSHHGSSVSRDASYG